jgi:hypothetical protein
VISPTLDMALAQLKMDDIRRAVDAHRGAGRRAHTERSLAPETSLTLRFASPVDKEPLARLAALDGSAPPAQPVLLAEVDGKLRAALGLSDGTAVAHPFHRTTHLIELLRARARQLDGSRRIRRAARLPAWSRLRARHGPSRSLVETDHFNPNQHRSTS